MDQPTFADLEYQGKKRKTSRGLFLERMDGLIPWQFLEGRIRPFYPKPGRGRQPCPLSVMLRTHWVQLFYNPERPGHGGSALRVRPGTAVRGVEALRPPARRDHHPEFPAPSGKTQAGAGPFEGNQRPPGVPGTEASGENHRGRHHHPGPFFHQEPGWGAGPADASDQEGEPVALRDEGAHRGRRRHGHSAKHERDGSQRSDVTQAHNLLHGGETVVWGDAGYQGVHKRKENLGLEVEWRVAMRPGSRRKLEPGSEEALEEKAKASVRAKVEHPFLRLKRLFGYGKVRYRGLTKNMEASGAAVRAG